MGLALSLFRQRLFVVLSVSILLIGLGNSLYSPYLTLFGVQEVGMSPMALGVFLSLSTMSAIVASTFIGRLSDARDNRKKLLLVVLILGIAGYAVFSFSREYVVLLLSAVLLIGFSSAAFPQLFAYANEVNPEGKEQDRAFATGILRSIFAVGWVIGPMIGAFVLAGFGFSMLYLTIAIVYALVLVIVALFINNPGESRAVPKSRTLFSKAMLINAASFSVVYLATALNGYALPLFITDTLEAGSHHVGYLLSLAAAIEIPLMIFGGYLIRYIGKLRLIVIGFLAYVAYCASILFVTDLFWLYPIQILNAIAISQIMSVGISYFQDLAPDQPGTTITLFTNTTRIGSVLGGFVFGAIVSWFDYRMVYLFCSLFTVVALLLLYLANTRRMTRDRVMAADA